MDCEMPSLAHSADKPVPQLLWQATVDLHWDRLPPVEHDQHSIPKIPISRHRDYSLTILCGYYVTNYIHVPST